MLTKIDLFKNLNGFYSYSNILYRFISVFFVAHLCYGFSLNFIGIDIHRLEINIYLGDSLRFNRHLKLL